MNDMFIWKMKLFFKQSTYLPIDNECLFLTEFINIYASCAYKSNASEPLTAITNDHIHCG